MADEQAPGQARGQAGGQLEGRVAIVTGAGRGIGRIGRAIALAFGSAGARVLCAARSGDEIESTAARETAAALDAETITIAKP